MHIQFTEANLDGFNDNSDAMTRPNGSCMHTQFNYPYRYPKAPGSHTSWEYSPANARARRVSQLLLLPRWYLRWPSWSSTSPPHSRTSLWSSLCPLSSTWCCQWRRHEWGMGRPGSKRLRCIRLPSRLGGRQCVWCGFRGAVVKGVCRLLFK